jgi:hypothetical protein
MLTGIHFLLTYACNFECDHCFLFCGPDAKGTFTLQQLREIFDEIPKIGTIEWVYFEGGEPFLFYPVMLKGIEMAHKLGLKTGIATNAYWATAVEDAGLWIEPLRYLDLADLSLSDDAYHHGEEEMNPARVALVAAEKGGVPVGTITIEEPTVEEDAHKQQEKGGPVIGGGVMFRGRAVDKLTEGLPRRSWQEFTECPYEELEEPKRVHLDPFGNVHLCQGLSMGNTVRTPLAALVEAYDAKAHPVVGPLLRGGPAELAREYGVGHEASYVDACHMCHLVRLALLDRFPDYLAPRQVYGVEA